jgi:hypothetical protein
MINQNTIGSYNGNPLLKKSGVKIPWTAELVSE